MVQIGHRGDTTWEVTAGLAAGDRVILHPGAEINEGTRVKTT
jgi:HlyD family secretion protein